ncbi:MAG: hypothetical protein QOG23_1951 [Blastocatellia bacterium]|nr:hypothetical protein [Blastocatellia bacterium]
MIDLGLSLLKVVRAHLSSIFRVQLLQASIKTIVFLCGVVRCSVGGRNCNFILVLPSHVELCPSLLLLNYPIGDAVKIYRRITNVSDSKILYFLGNTINRLIRQVFSIATSPPGEYFYQAAVKLRVLESGLITIWVQPEKQLIEIQLCKIPLFRHLV